MSNTPTEEKPGAGAGASQQPQQKERRKIEIKFIQDKTRRHITFSKRKHGIMKKAYELSVLTGTQVLLLIVSETGLVYTYTTPKFQPIVKEPEGRNLIQACLNAPDEEEEEEEEDDDEEDEAKNEDKPANVTAAAAAAAGGVAADPSTGAIPHPQAGNPVVQNPQGASVQQQPQSFGNPAAYLNAEQAAVYQQYFNGVNSQQGQY